MRTVIIVNDHGYVNGGQAKVAIETALSLRLEGLDVYFFFGVGPADPRLVSANVECICLDQFDLLSDPNRLKSAMRGLWNWSAASRLRDLLLRFESTSTILHLHGWAKSLSPSIGPVIAASNVPCVYTLHEYFLACPTGGFYRHDRQEICSLKPLSIPCLLSNCDPRSRAHKMWRATRQVILWNFGHMPGRLRDFIYLTETQLAVMKEFLPPNSRKHWLPNALDSFQPDRVSVEHNSLFLFVGRLSPEKGGELVARAAKLAGVEIAFAGGGDCHDHILRANPDALMLGWLQPTELVKWMRRARCLVFPSLWYECMPMSVIEGMQFGLPVLVSSRCAAAEFVRHDVDGLHVENGSLEAWQAALSALQSPERAARYGHAGYGASRNFLDPASYRRRLLEIYERASTAQHSERQGR